MTTLNEALGTPGGTPPEPKPMAAGEYGPPLWQQGLAYPAQDMRVLCDAVWPDPGILAAGALAVGPRAAGGNLSVDVAPGLVVIAGGDMADQGSYVCQLHTTVNVTLAAAPSTGLTRIDLVCARVYDDAVIGGGRNEWVADPVTGIPASTNPQPPALPRSAEPLAHVTVAAGTAAITAAMIADRRRRAIPDPYRPTEFVLAAAAGVNLDGAGRFTVALPSGGKLISGVAAISNAFGARIVTTNLADYPAGSTVCGFQVFMPDGNTSAPGPIAVSYVIVWSY